MTAAGPTAAPFRVGQGYDIHPWSDDPARVLILGGVTFDGHRGLVGHSDADAVAHACADAVLGAVGLGDIGQLFPDSDPANRDADSIALLSHAVGRVHDAGWSVVNVDCTVVCDQPRIAPVRSRMEHILSTAVGAPVTVKGKRTEGVAVLGDGVQCLAVALVSNPTGGRS